MFLLKRKKGFVLADAIMGMAVAIIIGVTLTVLLSMSNDLTERQMDNIEAYNFASSLIEEVQAHQTLGTSANPAPIPIDNTKFSQGVNEYDGQIIVEEDGFNENLMRITVQLNWKDTLGKKKEIEMVGFKVVSQ